MPKKTGGVCYSCRGVGYKMVPRVRVVDGKSKTEMVRETCAPCGGTGNGSGY